MISGMGAGMNLDLPQQNSHTRKSLRDIALWEIEEK